MPLNSKQQAFVDGVIAGKSATDAYRDAYKRRGKSAQAAASRLLSNVMVARAIAEARAKARTRAEITEAAWLGEWAVMGFASVSDEDVRPADKARALENIGKHLGFYPKDSEGAPNGRQGLSVDKTGSKTRITWGDLVLEV